MHKCDVNSGSLQQTFLDGYIFHVGWRARYIIKDGLVKLRILCIFSTESTTNITRSWQPGIVQMFYVLWNYMQLDGDGSHGTKRDSLSNELIQFGGLVAETLTLM